MMASRDHWTTEPAGAAEPAASSRCYGSLEAITDSERRALRPIGVAAREVAGWTGALLGELLAVPGVRIFQGVRAPAGDAPRIPHAVSAGRGLVLVESVAWPAGQYATTAGGRVHCDGVYIGQSVRPLAAAVRHWREALPDGHRVTAVVVVHLAGRSGGLLLAPGAGRDLAWARPGEAVRCVRARLPRRRQAVSMRAVAALVAATAGEENR
jgi:hypothetical protein